MKRGRCVTGESAERLTRNAAKESKIQEDRTFEGYPVRGGEEGVVSLEDGALWSRGVSL